MMQSSKYTICLGLIIQEKTILSIHKNFYDNNDVFL